MKTTTRDDGESIAPFEPLIGSIDVASRAKLNDLALTLVEKSAGFSASLPAAISNCLGDIVRIADCHYSNLIEGNNIQPIDIERAVHDGYSDVVKAHDLQFEARAHVIVQKWIDDGGLAATPFSTDAICEVHKRFCDLLPSELLPIEDGKGDEKSLVEPGAMKTRHVNVGRHVAICSDLVQRSLSVMAEGYTSAGRIDRILIAACGYHRLLAAHPFLHGDGRVARLVSYAALRSEMRTRGLWSVARGLAGRQREYATHIRSSNGPRQGSRDGRGLLSADALSDFAKFFLETCIEQVDFMSGLMEPHKLRDRMLTWAHEEVRAGTLPPRVDAVLTAILYRGELDRAEIVTLTGTSERSARRLSAALLRFGLVQSETSRASLKLAFPVALSRRLLPGLFPHD
ncbi:Fic family protein [Rhizobium leguminosarum]|uniref:Fic family protein n=1 Tax=Rhizobium leguminosarum TaxID=384 RepID=UPI00102FB729|nr:Fic family protein [Rhizobium leguminosarum]TAZ15424.1 Fic family protein [Rhizobium leguminosarum]